MSVILVFGSNLAGRHGAGAAREAYEAWGAVSGQGVGLAGQSYAIPTKDERIVTLPIRSIKPYVEDFVAFAAAHKEHFFLVSRVGCGLAGYRDSQIAPLFQRMTNNCHVSTAWLPYL